MGFYNNIELVDMHGECNQTSASGVLAQLFLQRNHSPPRRFVYLANRLEIQNCCKTMTAPNVLHSCDNYACVCMQYNDDNFEQISVKTVPPPEKRKFWKN